MLLKIRLIIVLFIFLLISSRTFSQNPLNLPISGNFNNITLFEFLEVLEANYGLVIYYDPGKLPFFKKKFVFRNEPLYRAVEQFLIGSNQDLIKYRDNLIISNKNGVTAEFLDQMIERWHQGIYKKPISTEIKLQTISIGDSTLPNSGILTLTGIITDKYNGEPVIGAVIKDKNSDQGTTTDENGYFTMERSQGKYYYFISYIGYQTIELELNWYESGTHNFQMEVASLNLTEILVEATSTQNKVKDTQLGVQMLNLRQIKEVPSLFGEADVIKSIERLPGVNTVSEASAGFNVRGGNIDQNLVLLDDGILLNTSHALGFLSTLNGDAIRTATLFKGSIPANYGGRLSSVLKADLREGNRYRIKGNGAVSVASARIAVDGPINPKWRFLLGLRSSYSDWILRMFRDPGIRNSRMRFNDGIFKLTYEKDSRNLFDISFYRSFDHFRFSNEFGYEWRTSQVNIRYRNIISDKTFLQHGFVAGDYASQLFIPSGENASVRHAGIFYEKWISTLNYQYDRHHFQGGVESIFWHMRPESIEPFNSTSSIRSKKIEKENGLELAAFIQDEFNVSDQFSLEAGLRLVHFSSLGPSVIRDFLPNQPKSPETVTFERNIGKKEKVANYTVIEPRLSLKFLLFEKKSIKFAFNRINQFIHLLTNSVNPTPVDIWQLTNASFKPQIGTNFSLGYFQGLNAHWNYSLEGFYKSVQNFPQFKDNASLLVNEFLETELIPGEGRSFGVEGGIEGKMEKWNMTLAYTWSHSEVKTTSNLIEEQINANAWYPAAFDQRHQIHGQIQFNPDPIQKVFIGFSYKSGRPVTAPIGNYSIQEILITHYSFRNQFRIPAYHRLDFGYTIDRSQAKIRGVRSSFTLSLINLLGRKNPYTIFFRRDRDDIQRAYRLSVLGTVFPSLNWNFTF